VARVNSLSLLDAPRQGSSNAAWALYYVSWIVARSFTIILLLVIWQLIATSGMVSRFMLPPPALAFERLVEDVISGGFFLKAGETLFRALAGFAAAAIAGVLLGMLMVRSALARWFFEPIISVGFPMPKIAFLPIFMLWFGIYNFSKIGMIIFDAIFPVITATIVGLQSVEREFIWSARNMGATPRRVLWQIMLPAALPQIMTGLQVALPISLIVAIATEMLMGGTGLGGAMLEDSRQADSPAVFAGLIEMIVVGYAAIKLMSFARRQLLLWHQETQQPAGIMFPRTRRVRRPRRP
jgi:ABC-type nitrate/sulfonate/bicarbonate transport system permease component